MRNGPAALTMLLGGCQATLPAAADARPESRLEHLVSADALLARIGHRLSVANVDLCPRTAMLAGWSLHAASLYATDMQAAAIRRFDLEGDLRRVAYVVSGGPAEAAGLRAGDVILAVDGRVLAPGPDRGEPDAAGFFANRSVVDAALAQGSAALRVRRNGETLDVTIAPVKGCGYAFLATPSRELSAGAFEDEIQITTAMAAYASSNDDLAVVVGHEFAHAVLQHRWNGAVVWATCRGAPRRASVRRTGSGSISWREPVMIPRGGPLSSVA